jgi:hypothetical protein
MPPGFTLLKDMLLAPLKEGILRGVLFESSSFSKMNFYIYVFSLPLCYPESHIYLNFGFRLRNGQGHIWDASSTAMWNDFERAFYAQAHHFINQVASAEGFAKVAGMYSPENPHTLKAVSFALARANRWDEAKSSLDALLKQVDDSISWQAEIAKNSRILRNLITTNRSQAMSQLLTWESESIVNLRLQKLQTSLA